MLKEGKLRRNRDLKFDALFKGPLVLALCGMLLAQSAIATAQEPAQAAKATSSPATEISRLQPVEELPSAPVPQAQAQPQQSQPNQQSNPQPNEQPNQQQGQPASPQAQQQPQSQPAQQPGTPQEQQPVGTAAAPYEKPTGVPGSRPAGAAIAPAKQRRVRAIVISLAVILAGAGAIGAVAGMSKASHSQP